MTNKNLRQKERRGDLLMVNVGDTIEKLKNETYGKIIKCGKLKPLGDLSRTKEKKTQDKIRKTNRNGKFISLGL